MLDILLVPVIEFITGTITAWGYGGIVLLMAIESASIPLPSEIIMPFAGFAASRGIFSLLGVAFAGAVGCLIGSWASYAIGYYGGRRFVLKYGRYVLFSPRDLERAEAWIRRYGDAANFLARLLPVVRTFVSVPAGILHMRLVPFTLYTFAGSFLWSLILAWIGFTLGERWGEIRSFFRGLDILIVIAILGGFGWFFWHKKREFSQKPSS